MSRLLLGGIPGGGHACRPRTLVAVLLGAIVTAAAIYASGLWGSGNSTVGRGVMPVAYLIFAVWAPVWRVYASRYQRQQTGKARWLVAGTGEKAARLYRDFQKTHAKPSYPFSPILPRTMTTRFRGWSAPWTTSTRY